MIPTTRTEISHGVDNTWTDVDVTTYVKPGDTAGVMLEIVNTTGNEHTWGVRKNDSTDDITGVIEDTGHTWAAIGVDSDDIFELYLSDASEVDVYIVAYMTHSEATFLTNASLKNVVNTYTWEDIDISGDLGNDIPKVVFALVKNDGAAALARWGIRNDGSTDDFWGRMFDGDLRGAMSGISSSGVFEGYAQVAADIDFYVVGWMTANVVAFVNGISYVASGAGNWEDVNFSTNIPNGWNGAFWHFNEQNAEYAGGIRKDGAIYDNYYDISEIQQGWVEITQTGLAEQKVENTGLELYLWGYTKEWVPRNPSSLNNPSVY